MMNNDVISKFVYLVWMNGKISDNIYYRYIYVFFFFKLSYYVNW